MPHLIAGSTNSVSYAVGANLSGLSLSIATSDGSAVAFVNTPTKSSSGDASSTWTLTLESTEIGTAYTWDTLAFTWGLSYSGQIRTDIEYFDVLPDDVDIIVPISAVKEHLGVTDTADDERIGLLLMQAHDLLDTVYGLPTVPKTTEQRRFMCSNTYIATPELVSVSSVYDALGAAQTAYTVMYGRKPTDHYRGIVFDDPWNEQMSVSGVWGYDDCPHDVKRALLLTVGTWYKRATLGSDADVIGGFTTLPREARDIMDARAEVTF